MLFIQKYKGFSKFMKENFFFSVLTIQNNVFALIGSTGAIAEVQTLL
jgi:hypothetical protein